VTLGDRTESVSALAWSAQAAVVLTGEDASWNGVKPNRPFDPKEGGAGAFELAVRWGELQVDDLAFDAGFADPSKSASRSRSFTVGLNWYLDSAVKLQLDYERTSFEGGAADEADRPTEQLVGARAQLLF
jgi:phosphate-selective porin OprO/OprP